MTITNPQHRHRPETNQEADNQHHEDYERIADEVSAVRPVRTVELATDSERNRSTGPC